MLGHKLVNVDMSSQQFVKSIVDDCKVAYNTNQGLDNLLALILFCVEASQPDSIRIMMSNNARHNIRLQKTADRSTSREASRVQHLSKRKPRVRLEITEVQTMINIFHKSGYTICGLSILLDPGRYMLPGRFGEKGAAKSRNLLTTLTVPQHIVILYEVDAVPVS